MIVAQALSVSIRWRRSQIAETFASVRVSAPCYRFPENIGVLAVVMTELELRQIQRQILLTYVVIGADDAALQQSPKGIERLSVNLSAHVLTAHVETSYSDAYSPRTDRWRSDLLCR